MEAMVIAIGASFVLRRDSWIEFARGTMLFIGGLACGYILFSH